MKRLIPFLALMLLFPVLMPAQTAAVSGSLRDVSNTAIVSQNTYVQFELRGFGGFIPRIVSSSINADPVKKFVPNGSGAISGNIIRNDYITPSGTFYRVCIFVKSAQYRCADYRIESATFDLSAATPINITPLASNYILGAKSYVHTQAANALTWTILHNFGDPNVIAQCSTTLGQVLYPDTVILTDANTTTVTFTIAQSGRCIVMNGGNVVLTTVVGDALVKNPNANQTTIGNYALTLGGGLLPAASGAQSLGSPALRWNISAGILTASVFQETRYAENFTGADIGAKVNAAYADLPPAGGTIVITPSSDGSCVEFTTPIVFGINQKPVLLAGTPNATCIHYTATSGAAITFNPGMGGLGSISPRNGSQQFYGSGLRNIVLLGPASGTAQGVVMGGANGCEGAILEGLDIEGFYYGILQSDNCMTWTVRNSAIMNNDQNIVFPASVAGGSENVTFDRIKLGSNLLAMPVNCFTLDNGSHLKMYAPSFDSCQLVQNDGHITMYSPHFEAIAGTPTGCTSNDWIVLNRGRMSIFDAQFVNNCSSGAVPAQIITIGSSTGNAEYLHIDGAEIVNSNASISQFIKQQGGARVIALGLSNNSSLSNPFSNGYVYRSGATGPAITFPETTGAPGSSSYTNTTFRGTTIAADGVIFPESTAPIVWNSGANSVVLTSAAATGNRVQTLQNVSGTVPVIIASGTSALGSSSVSAGACPTVVTTAAANALSTDSIAWAYASVPSIPDGKLILSPYVSTNNVNWRVCNPTGAALIPTGLVVNWRVIR